MPMPYDLLSPHLQALVAAAGLATACSFVQSRAASQSAVEAPSPDAHANVNPAPQRARLLLPPTR